jgi:hypothetical protein
MTFLRVGHGILSFSTFRFLFDSALHSASVLFESLRVPQYRLAWDIDISKLPADRKPVLTLRDYAEWFAPELGVIVMSREILDRVRGDGP